MTNSPNEPSPVPPADQEQPYPGPSIPPPPSYTVPEQPQQPPVEPVYGPPEQQPAYYADPSYQGGYGAQDAPPQQDAYPPQGYPQPQQAYPPAMGYQGGYEQKSPYQQPIYPAQQGYGQPQAASLGQQLGSNSTIMGIIAVCLAVIIGWIPFFGLIGVAGGVGLGIPAIIQGKRAEEAGGKGSVGKITGWVAIGFSALWVFLYVMLILIGAASDGSYRGA